MKPQRIAVLGAGGFLGSHLVPGLLERFDCEIDAVDVDFTKLEQTDARVERITARVEEPGLVEAMMMRASRASGFWVGCTFLPSSPFRRSWPLQIGNSQTERICTSSWEAFSAS